MQEKPDEPRSIFNQVLWFAIFMLVCFVAVLDAAGLLWPLSD
jgi:hypothetical protein